MAEPRARNKQPTDSPIEDSRPFHISIVPASHLDYGWAASPGECFSYVSEVIRMAVEDMKRHRGFKFTVEYAIFMKHFLEVYPEYEADVKRLVKEGRLEVCAAMSGVIEHWLDGEMLIHQLVRAKRWVRERLGVNPVTAQHTDLPGHILQIPQFLKKAEIDHLAYSRYHPPVPVHRWRAPDGSEVVATCHNQEALNTPHSWEGYGWGWVLFVNNDDPEKVEKELSEALTRRAAIWPKGVNAILMGCESDLQPSEPAMLERIARWNKNHPKQPVTMATITEYFRQLDPKKLPVYQGEAPYAFFSLPSIYIAAAQAMRRGDNAMLAAEKWGSFGQMVGLGRVQKARIAAARDAMFLPYDHNTGGRRGEINDAERVKDATHCCLEAESMLQESAMRFTVHVDYRRLEDGVFPITVFNSLSWDRDDVVETYFEAPMTGIRSLNITDSKGRPVASQIVRRDKQLGYSRIYLVFVARQVPAHGYETYYVRPSKAPDTAVTNLNVTKTKLANEFLEIRYSSSGVGGIRWQGRELTRKGKYGFNRIYVLEDKQANVESPPWAEQDTYTGKEWVSTITRAEVREQGPVRAIVRFHGKVLSTHFAQDVILYEGLERVDFRHILDYRMKMHTMTRVAYPLNVPQGEATYESPYGAVRLEADELPGSFRGLGERWVQRWIDVSNKDFGVTLGTRQVSHVIRHDGIDPILVRTAVDCGTIFYYYNQQRQYVFDYSLRPHARGWKQAAAHRGGWEFNSPLYSTNWTTCFPIKPVRLSRNLPERRGFLKINAKSAVVTAVTPSDTDPDAYVVRVVEYHGKGGVARLDFDLPVSKAKSVNFLERDMGKLRVDGRSVHVDLTPYGIHSIKVWMAS